MIDFTEKVVFVTGGSRGIGAATAELAVDAGARVAFTWRSHEEEADAVVSRLGRDFALGIRLDVRDDEALGAAARATVDRFGGIDVLVANAGIWEGASIAEMTPEAWERTLAVNLTGTFLACRHAVPAMRERGGGAIVVVSSTAGQRGEADHGHYAASKGGQISLVKSLAVELAPEIRVNAVAPGWVDTDMSAGPLGGAERDAILAAIPLKRVATANDVAHAVLWLASDAARHVTGEILNVNGGAVLCG